VPVNLCVRVWQVVQWEGRSREGGGVCVWEYRYGGIQRCKAGGVGHKLKGNQGKVTRNKGKVAQVGEGKPVSGVWESKERCKGQVGTCEPEPG